VLPYLTYAPGPPRQNAFTICQASPASSGFTAIHKHERLAMASLPAKMTLCQFLALPAEVRITIYELVFATGPARTILIYNAHSPSGKWLKTSAA